MGTYARMIALGLAELGQPFEQKRGKPPVEGECALCFESTMVYRATDVFGHNFGSWGTLVGTSMELCAVCAGNIKNADLMRKPLLLSPSQPRFLNTGELLEALSSPVEHCISFPIVGRKMLYPYMLSARRSVISDSWEGAMPWTQREATAVKIVRTLIQEGVPAGALESHVLPEFTSRRRSRATLMDMWRWLEPMKSKTVGPVLHKVASMEWRELKEGREKKEGV